MRQRKIINLGRQIIGIYLFLLVAIWSGSALQTTVLANISSICILLTGFICAIPVLYRLTRRSLTVKEGYFLFTIIWVLLNSVFYPMNLYANVLRANIVLIGYYISERYCADRILKLFIKFSVVVAFAAMLGTFLLEKTSIMEMLPTVSNVNGVEFKIGGIYNYITTVPDRVCGFFWEPGLLATCMVYATILYSSFYLKRIRLKDVVILSILMGCCICAKSSAGYVLGVLSIVAIFLRNDRSSDPKGFKKIIQFALFVLMIFVIANIDAIITILGLSKEYVFSKLISSNLKESLRVMAITNNLEIWAENPFIGVGISEAISRGKAVFQIHLLRPF